MQSTIRVLKFWTVYKPGANGEPQPVDMVEYGPAGGLQNRTNVATVTSLSKLRPLDQNSEDEAAKLAHGRWAAIEPLYRKWKDGEELPEQGTPFAAWNGISNEQAAILKMAGIKTVDDLASAPDAVLGTIKLPNIRALKDLAARFLTSFDKQATAQRLAAAETEAKEAKEQLSEMKQIILEMQRQLDDQKPKRGRPKAEAAEEDVAA